MAPVFITTYTVASMDSVIELKVKNKNICPGVILVHHGASLMGSASIVGDIFDGSTPLSSELASPNSEAEGDSGASPNGDAGAAFRAFKAALRDFTWEGSTSPPAATVCGLSATDCEGFTSKHWILTG